MGSHVHHHVHHHGTAEKSPEELSQEQKALGDYIVDRLYEDVLEGRGPLAQILKMGVPVNVSLGGTPEVSR